MIRKGTYVLIMTLDADRDIQVGALGTLHFDKGRYCYVGSAMAGIDQRVGRHLSRDKRVRWHIDNLTLSSDDIEAFISYPDPIGECELGRMAMESGMMPSHRGFGCSDCGCDTHLFRVADGSLETFLDRTGMTPFRER